MTPPAAPPAATSAPLPAAAAVTAGFTVRGLRWWIVGLVFLATVINYVDRQTINVLSPVILKDLGLSKIEFSRIAAAFLAAYTIGMAVWGRLFDRIGTRRGFAASIVIWSTAACLHALAAGKWTLGAVRGLLGFGEAGNWPGAGKCIAEWFPARERALATAIFNSGAAIGAVVAPPIIIAMQLAWGWQRTFLVTGALGFVWLLAWILVYRPPARHPWLRREELALIREGKDEGAGGDAPTEAGRPVPLGALLRRRQTWGIIAARFCTDPIWWLYLIWLPQYLFDARGFDLKTIGAFAWMPFLAADLGALTGGFLAGRLIRRGLSVDRARKTCLLIGAALMPMGIFAGRVESPFAALGLISLVLFAFQLWINNVQSLPGDFYPSRVVGAVFGLGGAAAGVSSLLFTLLSGWVVERFSYTPIFTVAGILGPVGAVALVAIGGRIERVRLEEGKP
jgi:ACS family hexuronate transporter-like MFS transporter